MFNNSNGYSLADIAAATGGNNRNDGMWDNGAWWIIILFLFCFNGGMWGNIAVPADGTAGPISLAIAIDGEPINTTTMIYTPTAVSTYGNIFGAIFIDIPRGCCGKVSVRNISTIPVSVQNANLIVERVA